MRARGSSSVPKRMPDTMRAGGPLSTVAPPLRAHRKLSISDSLNGSARLREMASAGGRNYLIA